MASPIAMDDANMHSCILCGTSCPVTCYRSHRKQYSCHNADCAGHAPIPGASETSPDCLVPSNDDEGNDGYRCTLCGSFCKLDCYVSHADGVGCHNEACMGHAPVPSSCKDCLDEKAVPTAATQKMQTSQNAQNSQNSQNTLHAQNIKREEKVITKLSSSPPDDNKSSIIADLDRAMPPKSSHAKGSKSVKDTGGDVKRDTYSLPYTSVETNFCQRSSYVIPGDDMRNNMLAATVSFLPGDEDDAGGVKPSMSMIFEGLYVGNAACAEDGEFLEANGITAVITVLEQPVSIDPAHPLLLAIPLKDRLFVRARDTTTQDLLQFFTGVCNFIDQRLRPHLATYDDDYYTDSRRMNREKPVPGGQAPAGAAGADDDDDDDDGEGQPEPKKQQRVLIHCEQNLSRSSALAAAYVMYRRHKSDGRALSLVQKRAPPSGAWPNAAFREQLQMWWALKFKLYRDEFYKVPCDEYEKYRFRLSLEKLRQACGEDQ